VKVSRSVTVATAKPISFIVCSLKARLACA
jgi:hypothetical protein